MCIFFSKIMLYVTFTVVNMLDIVHSKADTEEKADPFQPYNDLLTLEVTKQTTINEGLEKILLNQTNP